MAILTTFFTCFRSFFTVAGETTAAVLTAFFTSL